MNSYLDNLVLRTLALAPLVQPRLPSVFESSPVVAVAAQVPGQAESADAAPARPADAPGSLTRGEHTTVQFVQPQTEHQVKAPATRARHEIDEAGRSQPVERREVTPGLPMAEDRVAVRNQNPFRDPPKTDTGPRAVAVGKESIKPPGESRANEVRVAEVEPHDRDNLWRKLEPRVRQAVRDEQPRPAASENTRENLPAVQPHVVPAPTPKHDVIVPAIPNRSVLPRPPVPYLPPAPDITVTIGRVEVRAVMSSSAPSARRDNTRPNSPTSLDQYLKQRSEGRR